MRIVFFSFSLCSLACTENLVVAIEDVDEGGGIASSDTAPEQVPAADTSIPAVDTSPPQDTSPPVDTASPEPDPLRESCLEILLAGASVGDGEYEIDPPCGDPRVVTCDMTTDGGGWTRITELDFATDDCPGDWQAEAEHSICSRQAGDDSERIRSASFDTWCIPYDAVHGQLVGYQYGSTDGFGDNPPVDIEDTYGDVLSVTVAGSEGTTHLFTYGFGFKSEGTDDSNCPGVDGGAAPPAFVGDAYQCETGNLSSSGPSLQWYIDVPLFDADWFRVETPERLDVPIDVRLVATSPTSDEDVGVGSVVLEVR